MANRQDLTLRNLRASKKRAKAANLKIAAFRKIVKARLDNLELRVKALEMAADV